MYIATLVFQSTPMLGRNALPNGNILGMFKQNKLVKKLNLELTSQGIPWKVRLDDSVADIDSIKQDSQAIICVPGLEKQFEKKDFPSENIYYFKSIDYHNLFIDDVIHFLKQIHS